MGTQLSLGWTQLLLGPVGTHPRPAWEVLITTLSPRWMDFCAEGTKQAVERCTSAVYSQLKHSLVPIRSRSDTKKGEKMQSNIISLFLPLRPVLSADGADD